MTSGEVSLHLGALVDRQVERRPLGRRTALVHRGRAVQRVVLDVVEGPRPLLADDLDDVVRLAAVVDRLGEDVVLHGDRVEEEDQHHDDRGDRVEDLDRQVVARLHRDLVLAAATEREGRVADQAPDDDAGDQRGDPGALPQVEDRGSAVGGRLGHRKALDLRLVFGRAGAQHQHAGGQSGPQADPARALGELQTHERASLSTRRTGRTLLLGQPASPPRSTGSFASVRYLDNASSEPLASRGARDAARGPRAGVRRPGPHARSGAFRPAAARQRARGRRRGCWGSGRTRSRSPPRAPLAVHLGVLGLLLGRRRASTRLVHSAVEHSAVFAAGDWWAQHFGGTSDVVGVDALGRVSPSAVAAGAGRARGGARRPVGEPRGRDRAAAPPARRGWPPAGDVPLFVDFAASAGRLDLPPGWSAAAASAHKWGGPAGVGLLLVRKGARWRAPFPTDDRVDPRVAGFENVPGALAAAAALQAVVAERASVGAPAARPHRPDPRPGGRGRCRTSTSWATRTTGCRTW